MPPVRVEPSVPVPIQRRRIRQAAARYRVQLERGDAVGRLSVPRLDLNAIVVEGTDSATLTKGPGRYTKSYVPGEGELIYIAGHRTTYGAPLARIDRLREGDEVRLEVPYGTFVYRVSSHVIVPASDIERLESSGREEIALQACHPRFFATERYIVYARPVSEAARRQRVRRRPRRSALIGAGTRRESRRGRGRRRAARAQAFAPAARAIMWLSWPETGASSTPVFDDLARARRNTSLCGSRLTGPASRPHSRRGPGSVAPCSASTAGSTNSAHATSDETGLPGRPNTSVFRVRRTTRACPA